MESVCSGSSVVVGSSVGVGSSETGRGVAVGVSPNVSLGSVVGTAVGSAVGVFVGSGVGVFVGSSVGVSVGSAVGVFVGTGVGVLVGSAVGVSVGSGSGVAVLGGTSVEMTSATAVDSPPEVWQPDINRSNASMRADNRRASFFMITLPRIRRGKNPSITGYHGKGCRLRKFVNFLRFSARVGFKDGRVRCPVYSLIII